MSQKKIVKREEELKIFREALTSKSPEFIAVYGRRRVGKTFLIREFFRQRGFYMEVVGQKDAPLKVQLENFIDSFSTAFLDGKRLHVPKNWREAFQVLTEHLKSLPKDKKAVIFLDELPWMATRRSNLIQTLDYFWNAQWSLLPNVILIACGSAASWMIEHLIHAKGGLYNRLTRRMLLKPFTLNETAEYLKRKSLKLTQKQILDLYMVMGGIPYYLDYVRKGKSTSQTINQLCFEEEGLLYSEFNNIFPALFDSPETCLAIIRAIANGGNSVTRTDILQKAKLSHGGRATKALTELEASGFILSYLPYGKKEKGLCYRIIDEYTLFYLKWIEPLARRSAGARKSHYWHLISKPKKATWAGMAFESVCFKHIDEVIKALGITHVASVCGRWKYIPRKGRQSQGAEIDLLFDRDDDTITLCEIKYGEKPYVIDKPYQKVLLNKVEVFQDHTKTKKMVELALITTGGLRQNVWTDAFIDHHLALSDLFKP